MSSKPLSLQEAQKRRAAIRRLQQKQDEQLDLGAAQLIKEVEVLYSNFFESVKNLLTTSNLSEDVVIRARELQALASDLQQTLQAAGLENVLRRYEQQLTLATSQALEYFKTQGIKVSKRGVSLQTIETAIAFRVEELNEAINAKTVKPLRIRLIQNIVGTKPTSQIVKETIADIDAGNILRKDGKRFTDHNVEVLVEDTSQRLRRRVIQDKAASLDLQLVEYRGPSDEKTRPACDVMLNHNFHGAPGIYYIDEVTTDLHEDLTEDPLIAGGGWNCRHAFHPVTLDYAQAFGFVDERGLAEEIPEEELND